MFSKKLRIPSKLPIPQYPSKRNFSIKPQVIELTPVVHEPENLTPNQAISKLALTGLKRGNRANESIFLSSIIGGCELSVAGLLLLKVGGGCLSLLPSLAGLHALLCGLVFPIGLAMIVITGADLVTSNMMYATLPFLRNRNEITKDVFKDICRFVGISFAGNFIACVGFAALVATGYGFGGMATFASSIAVSKTSYPFYVALWKGVLANWLVNIAVLMSSSTNSTIGKIFLIWIPISTFVTLGFEHCVANMFLIPFGIFSGAPVTWSMFLLNNLLPVTIGNFIGASVLVSLMHSKAFTK